jgi:radical SAM protein with 4Fe4S-binding SPASM domain
MMVRPKCAPHFKRILYQKDKDHPLLNTYIAACRAGTHYCRITPEGEVSPCPYMPESAGDLKTTDFKTIWDESESLNRFRKPEYGGKCGMCQYRLICGGCRARAFATLGDDMGEDQWCVYEPMTQEEAITNPDAEAKFDSSDLAEAMSEKWTEESKAKMMRIPVFARSIVQKTVEKYAEENGIDEITPEVMRTAAPPPGEFSGRGRPSFASVKAADVPPDTGGDIPWDEDARKRVEDAPEFVRPGILKLMQKRSRERKQKRITTEFLTEIRNESMMLVTRRMKKFGFDGLDMAAWDTAKEKFKKIPQKQEVIDEIVGFLGNREKPNESMLKKFESFFEDDSKEIGWTKEARDILKRTPFFVRGKAKAFIEKHAKENGYKYVTDTAIKEAMEKLPFASMMKR